MLALACDPTPPQPSPTHETSIHVQDPHVQDSASASSLAEPIPSAPPPWLDDRGALLEPDHWLPGPARPNDAPRDPSARLVLDQGCRRCHPAAAHQWSGSQHASAWSSAAFTRAFTAEPLAFCQRCHAPEEDARTPVAQISSAAADLGVACVTCHVQPGTREVWAAPLPDPRESERAPHPILRAATFAGPQVCAACHEFSFPDHALREHPLAMQSTISEHRESPAAARSCADCHMPENRQGARSHAFAGAYDRSMLASALEIDATRPNPTTVRLRLRPGRVGHAVPTGDLLRRLMIEVRIDDPDGRAAFSARRFHGRRFGPLHQRNGITVRGELLDDRIGPGPDGARESTFAIPEALADRPVRWRIVHQRVAQASTSLRAGPLEGELEFARGVLQAPTPGPSPQMSSPSASAARSMMN